MKFHDAYGLGGTNHGIFHAVNSNQGEAWDAFMILGTRFGNFHSAFGWYMGITVIIMLWRMHLLRRDPENMASSHELGHVLMVLATVAIAHALSQQISETLKTIFAMPRPYLVFAENSVRHIDPFLTKKHDFQSFPSGHATFAAATLFGYWPLMNRAVKILASFIALWVMVSRMALGVHFPSDLIAGFLLGTVTVLLVRQLLVLLCKPALSLPKLSR